MNSTVELYGERRNGGVHGDVFTSPEMVRFMLDLAGYTSNRDLSRVTVLEPSFGSGEFLMEIMNRVKSSALKYGFDPGEVLSRNLYACEIDEVKYKDCIQRLTSETVGFRPVHFKNEDFLLCYFEKDVDLIVGNPPYVRYENIPEKSRNVYKERFSCFHYRCDLYVLFYEHSLGMLKSNGRHCFICSNRWLRNEYGRKLRSLIANSYRLEYIIDVENLDVFKESVLAYPAVTLITNKGSQQPTRVTAIDNKAALKLPLSYKERSLERSENWDALFLDASTDGMTTLEEQGFRIGIGVATGADGIFISDRFCDSEKIEPQLLLPIVNARDLTGNEFRWNGRFLLNPYLPSGELIELDSFPNAKRYLESKRSDLEKRHIVKNKRVWYALIDKIKPALKSKPKILLPDITGNDIIFVDDGHFYPAHNIYYVEGKSKEELTVLAAILMSDFVKSQIMTISNKMNGGLPRWQSRSIRKLRLPKLDGLSVEEKIQITKAYYDGDIPHINVLVDGIVNGIVKGTKSHRLVHNDMKIPKSIFDYDFS